MQLLIVRHADAGDKEEFAKTGKPDSERPLSDKGRRQMEGAVEGLVALVPECDTLVTSPYVRARQTAEIVAQEYDCPVQEATSLEPERSPEGFARWCRDNARDAELIIAVGHEPHLSTLATWLMTGDDESHIELKKGGACLLEFDDGIEKSAGTLCWLMGPKELRSLG
ncbi:MAG TPA: histidine phosphatase family protein [Gemmatimonadaceae bacterium]|nr:histidine phosphatase family protein [Gemmatimonadaceae bacterium]